METKKFRLVIENNIVYCFDDNDKHAFGVSGEITPMSSGGKIVFSTDRNPNKNIGSEIMTSVTNWFRANMSFIQHRITTVMKNELAAKNIQTG
jgi:hypothetical protein